MTTNYLAEDLRLALRAVKSGDPHVASDHLFRIIERVEKYHNEPPAEVDATTELQASGLTPEQDIRDRALTMAIDLLIREPPAVARSSMLWAIADQCAAYITDGSRAS